MEILFLFIGLLLGAVIGWFVGKSKTKEVEVSDNTTEDELAKLEKEFAIVNERYTYTKTELEQVRNELTLEREKAFELNARLESSITHFKNQKEKIHELESIREKFLGEFENISAKVIKQNTEHLSTVHSQKLSETLKPLGERIKQFEDKIDKSNAEQNQLKGELNKLFELNQQISSEAKNLTSALKGDTKKQGNWGELVLEKVLESSGLKEGREYETQYSVSSEDGSRLQPDVVVKLPDERHIIVDSKVSLVAYEAFMSTEDELDRIKYAKELTTSIKNHIKGLSDKNYQGSKELNSPDFVLLFMPIESAFSLSLETDDQLYSYAWDRKIVIVSPTTLLATLRTVASIWKQEKQTQNAIKIAQESGKLYDKFVGFLKDMKDIGARIGQTQKSYDDAMNKLTAGSGNLVGKAEKLRKMGANTTKQIDPSVIEELEEDISQPESKE